MGLREGGDGLDGEGKVYKEGGVLTNPSMLSGSIASHPFAAASSMRFFMMFITFADVTSTHCSSGQSAMAAPKSLDVKSL